MSEFKNDDNEKENEITENNDEEESSTHISKEIRDMAISIVVALVLAIVIKNNVFARADVQGPSMMNTLKDKDVLFVEKICTYTHNYKRGEIIIFDSRNENHDIYIKRIIAVVGDTIELKNGSVYLNGKAINESYKMIGAKTKGEGFLKEGVEYKVPTGYVFAMGDNREDSLDCREIGPVNLKDIKGHAIIRAYPFKTFKVF